MYMFPKTTVRPGDSCSQFIIVKEYRLQSIKGKGAKGEVQEKPGMNFQMSPQWSHMGTYLILSITHVTIHVMLSTREAYLNVGVQNFY